MKRPVSRSVPATYAVISLVLVVGAVSLALSTPPPSTPPLAAVAPAPQEQVDVQRIEQDSRFGDGNGGDGNCAPDAPDCAGTGQTESADPVGNGDGPSPAPSEVVETQAPGAFRRCVAGPGGPRQTDDPQSPRCVSEVFAGDNGGETSRGVTRQTIRVAVPWKVNAGWINGAGNEERDFEFLEAWAAHFEQHYELYGRKLELVKVERRGGDDPATERAFATDVAAVEPFAVLEYESGSVPFYEAAAAAGIIVLDGARRPISDVQVYDRLHPYVWGVFPSMEQSLVATGHLACSALAGHTARHAGPELTDSVRRFGVIVEQLPGRSLDGSALTSRLGACQAPFERYAHDPDRDDPAATVRRMRDDGITTVVCVCNSRFQRYAAEASPIGFEPEWLLAGTPRAEDTTAVTANGVVDRAQRDGVFGLRADLRDPISVGRPPAGGRHWEDYFWFEALKEQRPDLDVDRANTDRGWSAYSYYAQLLILASGIQHAGPELTPATFAAGLQQSGLFPNPWVGAPPYFQPAVGFAPGDHTLNSDFALSWWRNSEEYEEQAASGNKGAWCYVGDGARFTARTFPADADELFFDPEAGCR